MRYVRVELWMYGYCVVRSQPISGDEAATRVFNWREVFGRNADVRVVEP